MSNEIAVQQPQSAMQSYCFANAQAFEAAQRMAKPLSESTLVPKEYQKNMANCVVALEVAQRIGASPLMVMQNLYIVHGKPSWSSQFIIAALNSCGRFTPLQFVLDGEGDDWGCIVTSKDKSGELLRGPRVTINMAKKEGWYSKNGSKWQTMPEMMLRYRAASFFGKLYAPDILMGMQTQEEVEDIIPIKDVTPRDNTPLKEAFEANSVSTENAPAEPENKLDEILSNTEPKVSKVPKEEIEASPSELAQQKAKEIIDSYKIAKTLKELEKTVKQNEGHVLAMPDYLQADVYATLADCKKLFDKEGK